MNWDQIETKWAAMTRRVRADWTIARPEGLSKVPRMPTRGEGAPAVLADRTSVTAGTARQKTSNE